MKAFQDFIRNNLSVYADMCKIINVYEDESGFNWISEWTIRDNDNVYRIYSLPASHTKSIKSNVKISKILTQDYGYYIENNCITMYLRKGYTPVDIVLKTLLQCHSYAMFIHTQSIYNGSNAVNYMEDKCIKDGLYLIKKNIKNCNNIAVYELSGIFEKNLRGHIYISDITTTSSNANIDARNTYTEKDTGCGTSISECIVLDGDYGERVCKCIDIYIGTNSNYDIATQHSNNVVIIKSEAEHKGLDILMQASCASEI